MDAQAVDAETQQEGGAHHHVEVMEIDDCHVGQYHQQDRAVAVELDPWQHCGAEGTQARQAAGDAKQGGVPFVELLEHDGHQAVEGADMEADHAQHDDQDVQVARQVQRLRRVAVGGLLGGIGDGGWRHKKNRRQ